MLVEECIVVDKEIILKQLDLNDIDELFKLTEKNKEYLLPWFRWASEISLENTTKFIEKSYKENIDHIGCDFGIYCKGKLIGTIALMNYNKKITVEAEIAYWLSKDYNGKGIMTKVCKTIEEYCFTRLGFDTLYILAFAENKVSRHIPEKLGFSIIDAAMEPTIVNNQNFYYLYYSKTQSEYKSNFWNYLLLMFIQSKIVINAKKGEYNKELNIICPVDFGYLKNDWEEEDQIDIFIGENNEKNEIRSIICTMNFKNKFSDIKILYDCDSEETNKIFSLLSEKEGVLLINNPNFEE